MDKIKVKDRCFEKFIDYEAIAEAISRIAKQINDDYKSDVPVFLPVLNGSFMFASDLLKKIERHCEISFIGLSSYRGTKSTGHVEQHIGLNKNLKGRRVIIIEDIIDSGNTIDFLIGEIQKHEPTDVRVSTLLLKLDALKTAYRPDYVGIEIPDDFIVGYGLDYNEYGRNYKDIYKISED